MSQTNWEADKMLDVYIYDYLIKRNLQATAKAFQAEGKVSPGPVAIDAPGGFLFEWWSVFWDIFIARTDPKHSDVAASYIETQLIKGRGQQEQLQQPLQQQQQQQQQQQLQMRQLLLQRHAQQQQQQQQQQQHRDGSNLLNGSANALINSDPLARHSPGAANMMAAKMYEERLKLPLRESLDDASMKGFNENVGQMVDANHATLIKSAATSGQPAGQLLHGAARAMPGSMPQVQGRSQQLPRSMVDIKNEIDPIMTPTPRGPDGSLVGVTGPNQGGNNLTLKGWPLTAIDQLRSGILQQKPYMQSSQPLHQLQMLTPQQHLLLQAQQTLNSSSAGDADSQRLRMFLNNRSMIHGKDSQPNPIGDVIPNVGSLMQSTSAALPRGDTDLLIKQQQGGIQQHQLQQLGLSSQQSQNSSQSLLQQDKMGAGSATMIGSTSNSFRGNDQASKSHNGRKRKQPGLSSGPANSSGTANTAGPSPSSAPSTPSTHTPGDVISMPSVQHNGSSSKPLMMFGSDGTGSLTSPPDQLVDVMKWVDKGELLVEDGGSLEENIESFLSHDDNDHRDIVGRCTDVSKGFSFTEVGQTRASTNKVVCCHFSFDGKLLATGGHDKKVVLWSTDMLKQKSTLEEHSSLITDVRFSPSMPLLATSSHDKTVRVWEADNPGYSLRTFTGHSDSVMSLDFHPNKEDLICSCDGINEIRYWSIKNGSCTGVFKGRATKMRFQPRLGRYLAAASENNVSVLDVETQACRLSLQGHQKHVHSLCWNTSGDLLASVSEDSVRVWSLASGSEGKCIHELSFNGNKFHSCVFHPTYPNLLVIGCYQFLELWNMAENKTMTLSAHEGLIASLAVSNVTGLVASASHDKYVKIWK